MSHTTIDKRGQDRPSDKIVQLTPTPSGAIVQANADGSIRPSEPEPNTLVLSPFPDGTCLKMLKREFPGPADSKPKGFDQHVLVNVVGDQLAITKNVTVAHLICDAVNMLFAAQQQQQEEHASLVNLIAPTKDLPATQH